MQKSVISILVKVVCWVAWFRVELNRELSRKNTLTKTLQGAMKGGSHHHDLQLKHTRTHTHASASASHLINSLVLAVKPQLTDGRADTQMETWLLRPDSGHGAFGSDETFFPMTGQESAARLFQRQPVFVLGLGLVGGGVEVSSVLFPHCSATVSSLLSR